MKPSTSTAQPRCPENTSGPENLKPKPQSWRTLWASLALTGLTLFATNAGAQNWIDADLGGPTLAGSTTTNLDNTYTIVGGGSDIWGNTSQCHYRYAWASGTTWDVICKINSFSGPDAWSKVELMIDKADLNAGPQGDDPFIAVMGTQPTGQNGGVNQFGNDQFRASQGGGATWAQVGTTPTPQYPNAWMKVHRNGSIFQLYYSYDGTTWTNYINIDTASSAPLGGGADSGAVFGTAWPNIVAVGIAVTAHNNADPGGATATISNLSGTFPVITAPTVVNPVIQVSNLTATVGCEASFSFATTNNSNPNVVQPTYQWYKNGVAITNATGTSLTWLAAATDSGSQYYCKATVPPPYNTTVTSVNSSTGTLTVVSGILVTNGLKREFFAGTTSRTAVEAGNVARATSINVRPNFDDAGGYGANYIQRLSGYFIPPTTASYVFFVASDDDSDIFLSTDDTAANKALICQEVGWSGFRNWITPGGNNSTSAQKRSDQFTDPVTSLQPWSAGIPLIAGQRYYIEGVMHQGGGGDDFSVTYQTTNQVGDVNWATVFADGTNSLLQATNHNIAFISYNDTTPTWTQQPTNITLTLGTSGGFNATAIDGGEFPPSYQWYSNSVPIAGATSSQLYFGSVPGSANGAQFYAVATAVMSGLTSTSSVATLQVASPVFEKGWTKVEYWYPGNKASVENGSAGIPTHVIASPSFESTSSGSAGNGYANRLTTLFTPTNTGDYVFFVNGDDACDLFVSTDSTAANKRLVAQESGWSNPWNWNSVGGGGSVIAQKRSDSWTTNNAGGIAPWASGIHLIAGQSYYIEMVHEDGSGGNNAEATFKLIADADPANGAHSKLTGNLIGMNVPRSFVIGFTQQPTNVTTTLDGVATFTVAGTTDSQVAAGTTGDPRPLWNNTIAYQWLKNGTPIPGAISSSYSFGPVTPLDIGDQFVCQIRSLGLVDNSQVAVWSNSASVTVTAVTGGAVFETGYALHRYWTSNPGVSSLENNTAGTPSWMMSTPAFEADITGTEVADNFSDDLLGYFIPQTTGDYVFFCNSDDEADLLLSTGDSMGEARLIAQQTSYGTGALAWSSTANGTPSQVRSDTFVDGTGNTPFAAGIHLLANQKYAMRIVHHQGGGGSYSCVTAKLIAAADPADGTPSTIRGNALGTYVPPCTYVNITNQPQDLTVNNYDTAVFSITAGTDSTLPIGPEGDWRNSFNNFLAYQWFKNGVAIDGATSPTLSMLALPSDNHAQIVCKTRALGYADGSGNPIWATSSAANLVVNTNAPHLNYAAYYANSNYVAFGYGATNYIIVAFDSPMDPVMLRQASTYTLPAGLTILDILINTNDYKSVALAVSGTITLPITVQVSALLSGMGGGLPVTTTTTALHTVPLTDVDIGSPGADPAVPGMMYVQGANAYTILTEGSDIWGNADGFNFAYEMKTNDFDVVVRQKSNKHTSNWAKGGLMVRETLDAGSRNWNIINDPVSADGINAPDNSGFGANAVECNARNATGGATAGWDGSPRPVPAYPNAWVRLKRTGNVLSAFVSTNGTSWSQVATNDPTLVGDLTALPPVVYIGLCTTAHNNDPVGTDPSLLKYVNIVDYDNYNSSYVGAPVLHATVSGSNITVTWTPNVGNLFASPALTGPSAVWTQVGTGGSVTLPITGNAMFFKVAP